MLLSENPPAQSKWCSYCNQGHPSIKCNIVTKVEARKQLSRNKGRCFLCLKGGHLARNCKGITKCFKCHHGLHHTSICDKFTSPTNSRDDAQSSPKDDAQSKPKDVVQSSRGETSHVSANENQPQFSLYTAESRGSVLLQTAKAEVMRPEDGQNAMTVRVVFDSCSQRSCLCSLKEQIT